MSQGDKGLFQLHCFSLTGVCDPVQAPEDHNSNQRDPANDSNHPSGGLHEQQRRIDQG